MRRCQRRLLKELQPHCLSGLGLRGDPCEPFKRPTGASRILRPAVPSAAGDATAAQDVQGVTSKALHYPNFRLLSSPVPGFPCDYKSSRLFCGFGSPGLPCDHILESMCFFLAGLPVSIKTPRSFLFILVTGTLGPDEEPRAAASLREGTRHKAGHATNAVLIHVKASDMIRVASSIGNQPGLHSNQSNISSVAYPIAQFNLGAPRACAHNKAAHVSIMHLVHLQKL